MYLVVLSSAYNSSVNTFSVVLKTLCTTDISCTKTFLRPVADSSTLVGRFFFLYQFQTRQYSEKTKQKIALRKRKPYEYNYVNKMIF